MKETFETLEACQLRIAEIDAIMGFPDNTGTLTYAVPQLNEETQEYEIEVGTEVYQKENSNLS